MSQAGGGPKRLNLKLRKFDMTKIKHDKVVVLIGKRETGKSFLVKDLLWLQPDSTEIQRARTRRQRDALA
jgi:ABC-type polar amino acid transport system ATPase subunit